MTTRATLGLLALPLLVTACTGAQVSTSTRPSAPPGGPTTVLPTSEATSPSLATPGPASSDPTVAPATPSGPIVTPSASSSRTAQESPPAGASGTAVDPQAYRTSQGWYFTSPSGSLHCAISANPAMDAMKTGCQASVLVTGMPQCSSPASNAPAVWIPADRAKPVTKSCVNQGFFVGDATKVLAYGASITAGGYRCASSEEGIRCTVDGAARGFSIAKEGIRVLG